MYLNKTNTYNSSLILELSVKFASQICHENIKKPLGGAYLADFGTDIRPFHYPKDHGGVKPKELSPFVSRS